MRRVQTYYGRTVSVREGRVPRTAGTLPGGRATDATSGVRAREAPGSLVSGIIGNLIVIEITHTVIVVIVHCFSRVSLQFAPEQTLLFIEDGETLAVVLFVLHEGL